MVKALKKDGASVFVVFDRSTNSLKKYIGLTNKPNLSDIANVERAWPHGDVYIIQKEVKFQEYGDGSIVFFPEAFTIPSKSPLGRPATAV